jgi:multiple sugar transport system permease protein
MGYAAVLSWVLFAVVLLFTLIQFRLSGRWVYYENE